MEDLYAVLEWEEGVDDVANVVLRDGTKAQAESMVRIAPAHLYRETRKMAELNHIKENQ